MRFGARQLRVDAKSLTPRERELLALVLEAHSDREISSRMGISGHTVRFHIGNLFRKFHVCTRMQLLRKCLR